jgi:hypothetical protein
MPPGCLKENRFFIAMVGDESGQCRSDKSQHQEESSHVVDSMALAIVLVYLVLCRMLLP